MRFFKFVFLILIPCISLAEGGGAAGTGHGFMILKKFVAQMPENSIRVEGRRIVDGRTGEPLIRIEQASLAQLKAAHGDRLVPSKLGGVQGFEFTPHHNQKRGRNYWAICERDGSCSVFLPLSDTNPKVPGIVGSLRRRR